MKLLYCQDCGDILAPYREANKVRTCLCGRHSVTWDDPTTGAISLCDNSSTTGEPILEPRAWLLGVTNTFLGYPGEWMGKKDIEDIIESHPDYYLFKSIGSCIVRFRPGAASMTQWRKL